MAYDLDISVFFPDELAIKSDEQPIISFGAFIYELNLLV